MPIYRYDFSWSWSRNRNYGQSRSRSRKNNFGSATLVYNTILVSCTEPSWCSCVHFLSYPPFCPLHGPACAPQPLSQPGQQAGQAHQVRRIKIAKYLKHLKYGTGILFHAVFRLRIKKGRPDPDSLGKMRIRIQAVLEGKEKCKYQ